MKYVIDSTTLEGIADAIREKNESTDTYNAVQMADAVRGLKTRRIYTGEITETYLGSGVYIVLAKNDALKEHRNDETLCVKVDFDVEEAVPYTVLKAWAFNIQNALPTEMNNAYQYSRRYVADGSLGVQRNTCQITAEKPEGVGCIHITEDGELRIYSNSVSNYALRPSKWTAIVEW